MDLSPGRRRFLGLAGSGATMSVAGCSGLDAPNRDVSNSDGDSTDDGDGGSGEALEPTSTVTAYVQPSREELVELQQRQVELSRRRTEMNDSEYRTELRRLQREQLELMEAAIDEFETSVEEVNGLEVDDSSAQMGVVLLEGTAESLIEALTEGEVDGLFPEAVFRGTQLPVTP